MLPSNIFRRVYLQHGCNIFQHHFRFEVLACSSNGLNRFEYRIASRRLVFSNRSEGASNTYVACVKLSMYLEANVLKCVWSILLLSINLCYRFIALINCKHFTAVSV